MSKIFDEVKKFLAEPRTQAFVSAVFSTLEQGAAAPKPDKKSESKDSMKQYFKASEKVDEILKEEMTVPHLFAAAARRIGVESHPALPILKKSFIASLDADKHAKVSFSLVKKNKSTLYLEARQGDRLDTFTASVQEDGTQTVGYTTNTNKPPNWEDDLLRKLQNSYNEQLLKKQESTLFSKVGELEVLVEDFLKDWKKQ
jgi:hypothetical protein